jgi:hypothetical protein
MEFLILIFGKRSNYGNCGYGKQYGVALSGHLKLYNAVVLC